MSALNRFGRPAAITAVAAVLSLAASGCVTVHGELEVVPTTTKAEAARALDTFVTAYNKADRTYDRSADARYVTGPLAAIDTAKLKAGRALNPQGNPKHESLKLNDAHFVIPKKAGWPRWFVANTRNGDDSSYRWVLVFTRGAATEPWAVSYLTLFRDGDVPKFRTDKDGWAEAVGPKAPGLAVRPAALSKKYADSLDPKASGAGFTAGPYTTQVRQNRKTNGTRPGLSTQYLDEPLASGDYAPVALRTADGGALVFFTTRRFEKKTAAPGTDLPAIAPAWRALMTGEPKQSSTFGFVSNQAAIDPPGKAKDVDVVAQIAALTSAEGS